MAPGRKFRPDPGQMALKPDISGNTINGLGERASRRPRHVYWHDPEAIPFGEMQRWFYDHNRQPELMAARERRAKGMEEPLAPLAQQQEHRAPEDWAELVKAEARAESAEDVGIARLDPAWVYEGEKLDYDWVVCLAIAMDYERLSTAPEITSAVEVIDQYGRCHRVAKRLAGWIRSRGFEAEMLAGPLSGPLTLIPAAITAGLGQLGKHGSIIHRRLGSSFRLAAVATNMPLVADSPDAFGAEEFCIHCQACRRACPVDAIYDRKQWVRGVQKWYVDFDKCLPFFNETAGCGACLPACPWSRPGVADNLVLKLAGRARRKSPE